MIVNYTPFATPAPTTTSITTTTTDDVAFPPPLRSYAPSIFSSSSTIFTPLYLVSPFARLQPLFRLLSISPLLSLLLLLLLLRLLRLLILLLPLLPPLLITIFKTLKVKFVK